VNDIYDKTLTTDDSINEVVNQLQHMTLRDVESCARIVQVEKMQKHNADKLAEISARLDGLTQLVAYMIKNITIK
jgi:hypothetical protein